MCTKLKRFTFEAIMLALMSFILYGCSSTSSTHETPAQRTVSGVVSDSSGLPFANAEVTAYAILPDGTVSTTPLSATVRSDGRGNFSLKIPESYTGAILFVAKETLASGVTVTYRSVLPSVSQDQIVYISPATDMVYQYIMANKGGIFTAENIWKATLVLEPFFGVNFTEIPPPALGSAPTAAQQRLLVVTQAIQSLLTNGTTIADLVTTNPESRIMHLGEGTVFDNLKDAIATSRDNLINSGLIPGSFTMIPPIRPIPEPEFTGITPLAPQNLTAEVTSSPVTVTLYWEAATDATEGTTYYIYRNGIFILATSAAQVTYTDNNVDPATSYKYKVRARDTAGNVSAASTVVVTTNPVLTYTVSGKVTNSAGAALPSVYVVISGSGSGIFITDASGNYTITGVRAGDYTITPALSGYIFTPVNRLITVTAGNIAGVDFAAVNTGTVTGDFTYPPGTIIGGISYPLGTVIGGITYPTATVIGGVTYPTGTVIGGVTYPNGVIIGGVSYPAGTIVGGVAFPVGALTAGVTYPTGMIIGGVTYPNGSASGIVNYPNGAVIGGSTYPNGTVIGGLSYPTGSVTGIIGGFTYNISGRVTTSGAALPGVKLDLVNTTGSTVATATTGFSGEYTFENVVFGSYNITASLAGYTISGPLSVTVVSTNIAAPDLIATQL